MLTASFVALRIVANPVSNVFQKRLTQRAAHPLFIVGATHALLTVALLPLLRLLPLPAVAPLWRLDAPFWGNMLVAALLAVGGNGLLVAALGVADLSVLGPVNAYKSVIGLVLAVFLAGEVPSVAGVAGVLLIVAGSYFVVERGPDRPRRNGFVRFVSERGVQLRLAALVLSATEAVFLKRALLVASPLAAFVAWTVLGLPVAALAAPLLLRGGMAREAAVLRESRTTYAWLAVTTGLMQLATLFTFGRLQVGYSLALFQLSTLLSVGLGYRYFQERDIGRRLLGSLVMIAGAVLIVVAGSGR